MNLLFLGEVRISFGHSALNVNRMGYGIDGAAKLNQRAVAGGLYDASAILGDLGMEKLSPKRLEPRQRSRLVLPHHLRVANNVR